MNTKFEYDFLLFPKDIKAYKKICEEIKDDFDKNYWFNWYLMEEEMDWDAPDYPDPPVK